MFKKIIKSIEIEQGKTYSKDHTEQGATLDEAYFNGLQKAKQILLNCPTEFNEIDLDKRVEYSQKIYDILQSSDLNYWSNRFLESNNQEFTNDKIYQEIKECTNLIMHLFGAIFNENRKV